MHEVLLLRKLRRCRKEEILGGFIVVVEAACYVSVMQIKVQVKAWCIYR